MLFDAHMHGVANGTMEKGVMHMGEEPGRITDMCDVDNVCKDGHLKHITRVSSGPAAWHSSSVACCAVPGSVTGMGAGVVGESRVLLRPCTMTTAMTVTCSTSPE